jgi:hypothetical protein
MALAAMPCSLAFDAAESPFPVVENSMVRNVAPFDLLRASDFYSRCADAKRKRQRRMGSYRVITANVKADSSAVAD